MQQHNHKRGKITDRCGNAHTEHTAVNNKRVYKVAGDIEHGHHNYSNNYAVCVAVEPHKGVELKQKQNARERKHDSEKIIGGRFQKV